ncbi:reverse transcriptase zinc-binding domain-containing protein [Tanacetum coccineum]
MKIQVPILNAEKNDRIVWKNNDGRECNFSLKEVYNDMREMSIEVKWAKMIWFSQCIPKHSFILWLAIQEKLMTYDRMIKWGYCDMTCCLLCKNNVETHDHLFFNCPFSAAIWKELKLKMRFKSNAMLWNSIVKELAEKQNGNNIWSIVRRLCLATVVCSIWRERNNRIFCLQKARKMEESERAKSDEIAAKQRQREQELEERITAPIAAPAPAASGKKYIPPCLRPNYKAPPVVESDRWDTRKKNDPNKW